MATGGTVKLCLAVARQDKRGNCKINLYWTVWMPDQVRHDIAELFLLNK
jgi:hypothetical protein